MGSRSLPAMVSHQMLVGASRFDNSSRSDSSLLLVVQMAFQCAYFTLYGRTECVYEPAMMKAFLHGRTEAIR